VIHTFANPDKVMVGTRGEVGARLFLFQVREGRRFKVVKCEKQQLAALAEWLGVAVKNFTRPGHLPDEELYRLEPEYEPDFAIGDIAVGIDEENERLDLSFESIDDDETLSITLTKEWAGGLAIAIARCVEAGRPTCPLCTGPLDPRGHDCPRTNGYKPPIR
jgi:uncharacterized repeat protein (TIGR03847 family)